MSELPLSAFDLRNDVKQLVDKAKELTKKYKEGLFCKTPYSDMGYIKSGVQLDKMQVEALNNLSRLISIGLLLDYDNVNIQQQRGLIYEYGMGRENWGQPTKIKPSGEGSTCIKLWSGTSEYQEQFEAKSETLING
ncbi:MAG: hypothetical protein Q7R33_00865 [Nitrosarchaeum sp.]|nr:hypothetical protein [Nitrosarchaeum sp.]